MKIEDVCKEFNISDIGDFSDGYHTFNELYHQRAILFATIVKHNKDISWKSYRHEDGELCFGGGWFIVGMDTPEGSYTYHYENKYWDIFECEELILAKHWDGHTDKDVTRLLSLSSIQLDNQKNVIYLKDVYKLIAGHSNYHGDNILSALTCVAEGKTVNDIEPLDNKSSNTYRLTRISVERTRYTGLTDKNGIKIFEHDIVKTKYGRLCKVVWFSSPCSQCWDLIPLEDKHKCPDDYDLWIPKNLEVVGNVHDSPKLLE